MREKSPRRRFPWWILADVLLGTVLMTLLFS